MIIINLNVNDIQDKNLRYELKIIIKTDTSFYGRGVEELLLRINNTHSIKKACEGMNMSYSKAWRIIKKAEDKLGFPLLESRAGGAYGGGSSLTVRGFDFTCCFSEFEKELNSCSSTLFEKYFSDYIK